MVVNDIGPIHLSLESWNPSQAKAAGGDFEIQFDSMCLALRTTNNRWAGVNTRREYMIGNAKGCRAQGNLPDRFFNAALRIREIRSINM